MRIWANQWSASFHVFDEFYLRTAWCLCDHINWWYPHFLEDWISACRAYPHCSSKAPWSLHLRQILEVPILSKEIAFLGHILLENLVEVDPSMVNDVLYWEKPKTLKEVRGFLWLLGYYCRFIENFPKIVKPMMELLEKDVPLKWSQACAKAF